jgi:hypothetical protein
LSDVSQGPGWWEASDGKWYPPKESDQPPAPGWWLAADGKWYPPEDHPDAKAGQATANAEQAGTDRGPRTVAQAAIDAMPVRRRSVDATDQIRTRNDASRQDAIAQAPARFLAASRALQALESELKDHTPVPTGATAPPAVAPSTTGRARGPEAAPSPSPPAPPAPATLVGVSPAPTAPAGRFEGPEPLMELRTSSLGADIDHIGDRVLVFDDRVELRDRLDRVRQHLDGDQITDVVIQRKFTGAVLIVESGDGASILTRGLRPEQAEQAKALIHKRTRGGRPARPRAEAEPAAAAAPAPGSPDEGSDLATNATAARITLLSQGQLNEADLLRKLADLHRAGVLTDAEFEDKIAIVGRLVTGESLVIG